MDSAKLETFLFVCKEKSFTKAAEKLFITPAAVKKQVDVLEDEVGVQLIYRSPAGCTLTAAGEVFQIQAKKILKLVHTTIEQTQQAGKKQTQDLRMGHSLKFNYGFISDILGGCGEVLQDGLVRFDRIKKSELVTALQKQIIDCFLYINPYKNDFPGIENEVVGLTTVHAIMRHGHPLVNKKCITISDLKEYDIYLSAVLDQQLYDLLSNSVGSSLHILDKEDRNDLIFDLHRNAVFLYPCPAEHNVSVPFDYPPLPIRLYYIHKSPTIKLFLQFLQDFLQKEPNRVII